MNGESNRMSHSTCTHSLIVPSMQVFALSFLSEREFLYAYTNTCILESSPKRRSFFHFWKVSSLPALLARNKKTTTYLKTTPEYLSISSGQCCNIHRKELQHTKGKNKMVYCRWFDEEEAGKVSAETNPRAATRMAMFDSEEQWTLPRPIFF